MSSKKKVAIITGSGKIGHIGFEVAKKMASQNYNILLTDIDGDNLEIAETELRNNSNAEVVAVQADIGLEKEAQKVVDKAIEVWGTVDALVNNAGGGVFGLTVRPFLEHTAESLNETMKRNLWTTIWMCRAALPIMVQQKSGSIINIGAESVRNGLWDHAGYNCAKGGVHGMTTGLAREFAPYNIRVNVVAPAGTITAGRVKSGEELERDRVVDSIPLGRRAQAWEMAGAVAFLASDESSFITGQVISVNGGSSML